MTPGDLTPPSDLESRLRFETLIADLSSRFDNAPVEEVDGGIEDAQSRVCLFFDLDLSALWLWSPDDRSEPTRPHLCCRLGGAPVPEGMDARRSFPWCFDQIRGGKVVSLTRVDDAPPEAARDRETCHDLGLKSVLILPLSTIGSPVNGALTFASMREERDWPDHLVTRLRLVARLFADALTRKRADAALRESIARLDLATVNAGVGIWSVDFESLRVWVSPLMREQQLLDPAREITYRGLLDAVHPADRETVDQAMRHASQTDTLLFVEYRIVQPDGTLRWIAARGRRSGSGGGEPYRLLGVSMDVTERKTSEAEVEKQRARILHANRAAQTSVLTASLAHELSQPLAAILTNAQAGLRLMERDNPDIEELREILGDIVSDDKRAAAVIDGLRATLRREGGVRTRIDLVDTIRGVLRLVHNELTDQGIELRARMDFDGAVLADRTQVQLVVLNLVTNAVEAMRTVPVPRRRLDVTATRSGPGEALVTVRDSGPGIPENQRRKMFEAFWTTRPPEIGLGLQISRSIVQSHGGRLWFTDNPDHGATFHFTLPLANGPGSVGK